MGFNPRTPCGVRQALTDSWATDSWFQSTHSLRSATLPVVDQRRIKRVSIHALLAECDRKNRKGQCTARSFNPRTPCGVRRSPWWTKMKSSRFQSTHSLRSATLSPSGMRLGYVFQSTHSLRSATAKHVRFLPTVHVSIHALLAECDPSGSRTGQGKWCFNPRTPCGVRHILRASDSSGGCFNPRTPCGVRPRAPENVISREWFQSTHSLRSAT